MSTRSRIYAREFWVVKNWKFMEIFLVTNFGIFMLSFVALDRKNSFEKILSIKSLNLC